MTRTVKIRFAHDLRSAANLHEMPMVRASRVKKERKLTRQWWLVQVPPEMRKLSIPLVVTMTRVSPRALDSDNVASAFKGIRDSVAAILGVNDGAWYVFWKYRQTSEGSYKGVQIEVMEADCEKCRKPLRGAVEVPTSVTETGFRHEGCA